MPSARKLLLICAALLSLGAAPSVRAETATVFAAASLKTVLDRVADSFREATGHEVTLSYAGSSVLARQIGLGAPADLAILANPDWMDWLQDRGAIDPASRRLLAGNRLVLIAPAGRVTGIQPLEDIDLQARLGPDGRLAMALVDAVPAGIYGRAALQHFGLWDGLAPRTAQADNVRAALALVATGATPLGIVYATDAQAEPRVGVLALFPEDSHPPILYPAARVADRPSPVADAFLEHLFSDAAQALLAEEGFLPPPQTSR